MLPELKYFKVLNEACLERVQAFLREDRLNFFSLIDASRVFSEEQVRICYSRSLRIFESNGRIRRPESLFLMLLSGENQISRAQQAAGITPQTTNVLAVYESPDDLGAFVSEIGNDCISNVDYSVPESDRRRDPEIFSRMARVQLNL